MNIKQKITAAAAMGGLALSVLAPASSFAAENRVSIRDNSAFSRNNAWVFNKKKTRVVQNNTTVANTNVGIVSNTGKNRSSFSIGGDGNSMETGDATTNVTVDVEGNTNTNTNPCDCEENSNTATISGNNAFSRNSIVIVNKSKNSTYQSNTTVANTNIGIVSNTGGNSSSFNIGGGSSILTGDTDTTVEVTVEGSTNTNN